jgi:hypothetical protein
MKRYKGRKIRNPNMNVAAKTNIHPVSKSRRTNIAKGANSVAAYSS